MYFIKIKKEEYGTYIYLYLNKDFKEKFIGFFDLYCYIRDFKIDFNDIKLSPITFNNLIYYFIDIQDLEHRYDIRRSQKKRKERSDLYV